MDSIKIREIIVEKMGDKNWVVVYFDNGTKWVPALIEQAIIAQLVVECERMKYGHGLARDAMIMPLEFLTQAIQGANIRALSKEYKLTHTNAFKKFFTG
jgi:hypothetical protein